jgi:hypothetical protein
MASSRISVGPLALVALSAACISRPHITQPHAAHADNQTTGVTGTAERAPVRPRIHAAHLQALLAPWVPPPSPPKDTRTPSQIAQAACSAADGSWRCSAPKPKLFRATGVAPIIPPAWTVAFWFVDPTNLTGSASDSNSCTTIALPCSTFHEINDHRWGCIGSPNGCPRFRQNTIVLFLSSQTGNIDQIYFRPANESGAFSALQGNISAAQQVATGTLSGVISKVRFPSQLLVATLTAGLSPGQLIVNSNPAHPSRAWLYKNISGNTWSISQPLLPVTLPANPQPVEVDTWANGDAYTIYTPVSVDIAVLGGTSTGGLTNGLQVNSLRFHGSIANDAMSIDASSTVISECNNDNQFIGYSSPRLPYESSLTNTFLNGRVRTSAGFSAATILAAGVLNNSNELPSSVLAGDIILAQSTIVNGLGWAFAAYNNIYIESGKTLSYLNDGDVDNENAIYGGPFIWGPGVLDVGMTARFQYDAPASNVLLNTGGIALNGIFTTAHSQFVAGSGLVTECGNVPLTVLNLDVAASATCSTTGFGGQAFIPKGASFTSTAFGD